MIDLEQMSTIIRIQALLILGYAAFRMFSVEKKVQDKHAISKYHTLKQSIPFALASIALDLAAWLIGTYTPTVWTTLLYLASDIFLVLFAVTVYKTTSYRQATIYQADLRDRLNFSNRFVTKTTAVITLLVIFSAFALLHPTVTGMAVKQVNQTPSIIVLLFTISSTALLMVIFFRKELIH